MSEKKLFYGDCNLGQNSLGKCDTLFVCVIKMNFFPLYPLPPFQCWLKNGQRLAQYVLHHIVNIGLGGGGGGGEDQYTF